MNSRCAPIWLGLAWAAAMLGATGRAWPDDPAAVYDGGLDQVFHSRVVDETGRVLREEKCECRDPSDLPPVIDRIVFSPDGSRYATSDTLGALTLNDSLTKKVVHTLERPIKWKRESEHHHLHLSFAFSPDGKLIAAGEPLRGWTDDKGNWLADGTLNLGIVTIWDVASGRRLRQLKHPEHPFPDVSIGAERIIALGGGTMRIWDRATGRELQAVADVSRVGDDPLIRGVISGPFYRLPNSTRLGDHPSTGLSADGRMAVRLGGRADCLLRCWDGATGRASDRTMVPPVGLVAVRPDGRQIAFTHPIYRTGGPLRHVEIKVYDFKENKFIKTFSTNRRDFAADSLCYSPDATKLVMTNSAGEVEVYSVADGRLIKTFKGPDGGVRTVVVLAHGIRAASNGWYGGGLGWRDPKTNQPQYLPLTIWDGSFDEAVRP